MQLFKTWSLKELLKKLLNCVILRLIVTIIIKTQKYFKIYSFRLKQYAFLGFSTGQWAENPFITKRKQIQRFPNGTWA